MDQGSSVPIPSRQYDPGLLVYGFLFADGLNPFPHAALKVAALETN